jgi:hypothetical protein
MQHSGENYPGSAAMATIRSVPCTLTRRSLLCGAALAGGGLITGLLPGGRAFAQASSATITQ